MSFAHASQVCTVGKMKFKSTVEVSISIVYVQFHKNQLVSKTDICIWTWGQIQRCIQKFLDW